MTAELLSTSATELHPMSLQICTSGAVPQLLRGPSREFKYAGECVPLR